MVRAGTPVRVASCPMVNCSPLVRMQTTVHLPAAGSSSRFPALAAGGGGRGSSWRRRAACFGRSGHDGTACDVEDYAGDPGGGVGGEERGGGGDVSGGAEPSERVDSGPAGLLGGRDQLAVALGQDGFGGDAVGPDPIWSGLGGEVLGEQGDRGLGRAVGDGRAAVEYAAGRGGHRDDHAAAPLLHAAQEALEGEEGGHA